MGDHLTINCNRKTKGEGVKCVLCEGDHPANYKGCSVYKELQKKQYPPLRQKSLPVNNSRDISYSERMPGRSYADAARSLPQNPNPQVNSNNHPNNTNSTPSDMEELKSMMKTLMQQMSTMLNLLTALINKS